MRFFTIARRELFTRSAPTFTRPPHAALNCIATVTLYYHYYYYYYFSPRGHDTIFPSDSWVGGSWGETTPGRIRKQVIRSRPKPRVLPPYIPRSAHAAFPQSECGGGTTTTTTTMMIIIIRLCVGRIL